MYELDIKSVENIRKGNFSWEIDFEKAEHSTSGAMGFQGSVDFEVKEYNDNFINNEIIVGKCKIGIVILDRTNESTDEIGRYNVEYHIELEPTEELLEQMKNDKETKEKEIKMFIMYILEPYFRYDFETVMYDAALPKNILPYGILHRFIDSNEKD